MKVFLESLQQSRSAGKSCRCEDAEGLQMEFLNACSTGAMQEFLKNAVVDAVPEKFWSFAASAACDFRVQSHVLQVPAHAEVPLAAAVGEVQNCS